jgi:hypothetical protein
MIILVALLKYFTNLFSTCANREIESPRPPLPLRGGRVRVRELYKKEEWQS